MAEEKKKPKKKPAKRQLKPGSVDGRPSIYTDELATYICNKVSIDFRGLDVICKEDPIMPDSVTIYAWRRDRDVFSRMYTKAKQFQAEIMIESLRERAAERSYYVDGDGNERVDSGSVASMRLQVDTDKWLAAKLAPRIYGDKQQIETLTTDNETLKKEIADIRAELDAKNKKDY